MRMSGRKRQTILTLVRPILEGAVSDIYGNNAVSPSQKSRMMQQNKMRVDALQKGSMSYIVRVSYPQAGYRVRTNEM
ncbi:hypothetical protein BD309DRAFT_953051, partial [Dichomitus squalens]